MSRPTRPSLSSGVALVRDAPDVGPAVDADGGSPATPIRKDPLPIGSVLRGRFNLLEVIGRGGASTVYRAADRMRMIAGSPEIDVAIKLVEETGGHHCWVAEAVHREARHLRQLQHPNIVQVFDSDQDGRFHYVVLELLRGRTVGRILRTTPRTALPLDLVLRILENAAAGLTYAHERGIVHGDLKPNNIFITASGQLKLLDFGAARMMGPPSGSAPEDPDAESWDAITPMYASPEMLRGEASMESDDVYSLAVLAYVMLTGRHPFGGHTALEAEQFGLRPDPPQNLSARRWRALAGALCFDPKDRPDTIEAFARSVARPRLWQRLLG